MGRAASRGGCLDAWPCKRLRAEAFRTKRVGKAGDAEANPEKTRSPVARPRVREWKGEV